MSGFPASATAVHGLLVRAVAISLAWILLAFPGTGYAQPIKLQRPTPEIDSPAPDEALPDAVESPAAQEPEADAGPPVIPATPGNDNSTVEVNPLDQLDPDAIGLLEETQGGMPPTLWQGTGWPLARSLLQRLPGRIPSPTMRELVRRVLVSRATVPEGKPRDESFIALRVDRLLAMGDLEGTKSLLALAPEERRDRNFVQTDIEARLYSNDNAGACARVRGAGAGYEGLYWQQARAFCLALSGEMDRATMMADILRERDREIEPAFFSLIEAMAAGGGEVRVASLQTPQALHLAMMRATSARIPRETVEGGSPAVLRTIALSPNAGLDLRILAAERAYLLGALGDEELLRFYRGIPFERDELNNPISVAESRWDSRGRALMMRAAAVQEVPFAKAEVLSRAWELGRKNGTYETVARTSIPMLLTIPPGTELTWFARDAARVLFLGGRLREALRWYAVARQDRNRSEAATAAEADLWPLALLADHEQKQPMDSERLESWLAAQRESAPEAAQARAIALFSMLEATGRAVPQDLWLRLLDGPVAGGPSPLHEAWAHSLEDAASGTRIGETVLLIGIAAGATPEGRLDVLTARRVVEALRGIDLQIEARAMAVETAIAAGI